MANPTGIRKRFGRPRLAFGGAVLALGLAVAAGCHCLPKACDRETVSAKVAGRTGFGVGLPPPCDGQLILPNGASLDDGLTEEEAILIALWNNALFQELLADLGVAHGDLVQAGLLPNPEFVYLFSVPDKPYRYLFDLPVEAIWLLPIRVKAAARESERVCERLTQAALDLIRDVRQSYADTLLAQGRLQVAEEAVRVRGEVARLAAVRLKDGDASPQETATARIDADLATQDAARIRFDVALAEERLRNLLALGPHRVALRLDSAPPPRIDLPDVERLTAEAVASRPDALAAERNTAAAAERLRLTKLIWFRLLGIADATAGNRTGRELGPGFRVVVPIFNWNQGAVARAEAELERAQRQQVTLRNQIIQDVHLAFYRYDQARSEMAILDKKVRPEVEEAIRRAERAYRDGDTPYVVVLETTRQWLDARLREFVLHAELRRTWAELERSVGRHLAELTGASAEDTTLPPKEKEPTPLPPPRKEEPAKSDFARERGNTP